MTLQVNATSGARALTTTEQQEVRDGLGLGPVATMTLAEAQSSVSGAAITDAQAQTGSVAGAAIGETRVLSTGVNAGTRVRWYTPLGKSAPVWCWDVYPQSQYQG